MRDAKIRLYVVHPLGEGQTLPLTPAQAHYLFAVMRQPEGAALRVFNGRDGEWRARVTTVAKRGGTLLAEARSAPQVDPPDLWLLFAPIRKARTDFIVEKAAELGAARILPVQTAFTNAERIRQDRLQAHAVEAAEQCGGTFVPQVCALQRLDRVLADWPGDRRLMFCDEALAGRGPTDAGVFALKARARGPWAILIGPEGGFSQAERSAMAALPVAHAVALGPRILRADTAAVAAMTLWQAHLGDWG